MHRGNVVDHAANICIGIIFLMTTSKKTWEAQFEARIWRPRTLRQCRGCNPSAANAVEEIGTHACSLCNLRLTKEFYSAAMWHDRAKPSTKRTLCKNCCRPKCQNPDCQTTTTISHHSEYPKTVEERDSWLCQVCSKRKTHPCSLCGIRQPQKNYSLSMWNNRCWKSRASNRVLCNDCRQPKCCNPDCTRRNERIHHKNYPRTLEERDKWYCRDCRHKCDLCGVQQPAANYTNSMWVRSNNPSKKRIICSD